MRHSGQELAIDWLDARPKGNQGLETEVRTQGQSEAIAKKPVAYLGLATGEK